MTAFKNHFGIGGSSLSFNERLNVSTYRFEELREEICSFVKHDQTSQVK